MKHLFTKLLFVFLALLIKNQASAQVLINEVSSSNSTVVSDENGGYGDWIELFNSGNSSADLKNYHLSDDLQQVSKWTFPSILLQPQSHLLVFADDYSNKTYVQHWETPVYGNSQWKYLVPGFKSDTNWRNINFNDASWLSGKGGFGYGDGDDSTLLPGITSVYLRKSFTLSNPDFIEKAILSIDYDDGFVAFLNGHEIARSNMGAAGLRPAYNALAASEHEAKMYIGDMPENFVVDKNVLHALLVSGNNVLSIEVHNNSKISTDLSAIPFFTLGINNNSMAYGMPPTWFSEPLSFLHANFKLAQNGGEAIVLSDSNGVVLDSKMLPYLQSDASIGRSADGAMTWCYFASPTPNSSNGVANCYSGFSVSPLFSLQPGFYSGSQVLSLSSTASGSVIYYTIDGSIPTAGSLQYSSPLQIDTTQTIRAIAVSPGLIPSEAVSNTYLINQSSHLPIFSLNTNPSNLWDTNNGIYVLGNNANTTYPYFGANYWQDWEKPVSVEYYDKNKIRVFQYDADFKINGNYSRTKPQKSFEVLLKGNDQIAYPLIPEKNNVSNYDAFILRNAGTDWNIVHFRDGLMQRIMKNTFTGYLGYEPCEVYLNGRYWGVYEIRENDNFRYVQNNFGYSKNEIDFLYEGRNIETKNGSDTGFFAMYNYAANAYSNSSDFYGKMDAMLDLQNYTDYIAAETYYCNNDWVGDWANNIKLWRPRVPGAKWKYILYDLDFGLGLYSSYNNDKFSDLISPNSFTYQSAIFNALAANSKFKTYFINRYADLINTIYIPSNISKIAYQMRDSIFMDMPQHFSRWGGSMTQWSQNISNMLNFANKRPARVLNQIQSHFNLAGQVLLTLQAYPSGAGRIQISTIIPDSLPWKGTYFNGNPVTITAIPNPGFVFSNWAIGNSNMSLDSSQSITLNFTSSDSVIAYFSGNAIQPHITFSEINYDSSDSLDAGDWLEIHNQDSIDIDLTGWKFRDADDTHTFTFPLGTIIKANGYLVLAEDLNKFNSMFNYQHFEDESEEDHDHKSMSDNYNGAFKINLVGPLGFGLSNTGEMLRLFNYKDSLTISMSYSKLPPWPASAAGMGYTLESMSNNPDLDNGSNWFAGCPGGSPGTFFSSSQAQIMSDSVVQICAGDSISLSAFGDQNYFFTWFKNGVELFDAHHKSIMVSDSGNYSVQAYRLGCQSLSQPVNVKIKPIPTSSILATSQNFICSGSSLEIFADSSNLHSYAWFKNGMLLSNEKNAKLMLNDSGYYSLRTSFNGCSSNSAALFISLRQSPDASLQQISNYTICSGTAQKLMAVSDSNYAYQWFRNDSLIIGALDSVYQAFLAGKYAFSTTLNACSKKSNDIVIQVNESPKTFIVSQDSIAFCTGDTITLNAVKDLNYTYQWYKNDTLLNGFDSAFIRISEPAIYALQTQNTFCSSLSKVVLVTDPGPSPKIIADSLLSICYGTSYQLKVRKSLGYVYQWMRDSLPILGATAYKFNVSQNGNYNVVVRLNSCVSSSNVIQVDVKKLPSATIFAVDSTTKCEGEKVELRSNQYSGLQYQWYLNGAAILGQTDSILFANLSGSYYFIQQDGICNSMSNSIQVGFKPLPSALLNSSNGTQLCSGSLTQLSVPSDSACLYQWFKNGQLLTGAINPSCFVADSGTYYVNVVKAACFAVSDSIKINLNPLPEAHILSLDSVGVCKGISQVFHSIAQQGVNYQWYFNGAPIPFAYDSLVAVYAPGLYTVEVNKNQCKQMSEGVSLYNHIPVAISWQALNSKCVSDSAFLLAGATPLGGNYSGFSVQQNIFNPQLSGAGSFPIVYSYIDSNACLSADTSFLEISPQVSQPQIIQNFNQLISSAASGNQWYLNDSLIAGAINPVYQPNQNGTYSVVVSDSVLCNSSPTYFNYVSTGILTNALSEQLIVYPNPGKDVLNLLLPSINGEALLSIYDGLSEMVFQEKINANNITVKAINTVHLPDGIYYIRFQSEFGNKQQKWIKN